MPIALPIRIDLFAIVMLLGIVQGLFLSYFFLSRGTGDRLPNRFLGALLLVLSIIIADIWLGYTNYMLKTLWFNDSTEALNFLIAPLPYLYIRTSLTKRFEQRDWWHFVPSLLYFLYEIALILPQSQAFKYHSYLSAFHPDLPNIQYDYYGEPWMFWLKDYVNQLTGLHIMAYLLLSFQVVYHVFRVEKIPFFSTQNPRLAWFRNLLFQLFSVLIVYLTVRLSFHNDLGDHITAAHMAFIIYATGFSVVRQSAFFHLTENRKKYEKSSLTPEIQDLTLKKLEAIMTQEKPFLEATFSLPSLSKRLAVSPHHLSQVLNESLGQSFFDFVAMYRIREAQGLLAKSGNAHLKIEEIAERVGYNSKSAFNTTFKKITGQTPSEFRRSTLSA